MHALPSLCSPSHIIRGSSKPSALPSVAPSSAQHTKRTLVFIDRTSVLTPYEEVVLLCIPRLQAYL